LFGLNYSCITQAEASFDGGEINGKQIKIVVQE